ncbi:MAG: MFS transporter [Euryarchaeota archaeon]|nr:MFS transporter [Euryarchaeota archaeon]
MELEREVGFLELLKNNPTFRRLWMGLAISMMGEWFSTVALFVLIYTLTGSELGIGLLFVIRMFSMAFPQIFTGMLADRFSRKKIMIWSNLLSAIAVLSLLLVNDENDVWLIYAISALLMALHAVFIPAESASIPNVTKENELLTANALNSATWSAALCLGASIGGFVVSAFGVEAAFLINALCFALGALMYSTITIPQEPFQPKPGGIWTNTVGNIVEGFQIIISKPHVSRIITAKALWAIFGGGLVYMLVLIGDEIAFGDLAAGIGILFAARGLGTGLGPIFARYVFKNRNIWPFLLGSLVSVCGVAYIVIGFLEWSPWIAIIVVLGHASSAINWVLSTVLLQERSDDEWRGRLFSTDFLMMTTVNGLSTLAASLMLEFTEITLREGIRLFAFLQVLSGIIWVILMLPKERRFLKENQESSGTSP